MVKNAPALQETWVQSLGREDPLEKEMAMYSSILAWRIPWTEEPDGLYSPSGHKRIGHNLVTGQQQQLLDTINIQSKSLLFMFLLLFNR